MNNLEELADEKALRREKKKRPRMKVHGRGLKKSTSRGVLKIAKIQHKKK